MWRNELHIDARLVNQELKVYYDTRRQMNYQIIRSTWIGDYVDPSSFLNLWTTNGPNNETGWSNTTYDRFIAEAAQTNDRATRYRAFQQAETVLLDDAPVLPGLLLHPYFPYRSQCSSVADDSRTIILTNMSTLKKHPVATRNR